MDRSALETLFRSNYTKVFLSVRRILGDEQLALDAVQEAFIIAIQKIHQIKDKKNFGAWVTVIACNCAYQKLNKEKGLYSIADFDEAYLFNRQHNFDETIPEDAYEKKEIKEEILNALYGLKIDHRKVVFLKYYFDLKDTEIADMLKLKVGTVKSRLNRAKLTLALKLNKFKKHLMQG